MRTLYFLSLLPGCITPAAVDDDPPGRNGLALHLEIAGLEELEDTAEEPVSGVDALELTVDEVRFLGRLDGEAVETTDGTTVDVELVGGAGMASLPTLSLLEGEYVEARYELRLSALRLEGRFEDEDVRVEVHTPVTWVAETSAFALPDGPDPTVRFVLEPLGWLDTVSLGDAEPDGEGDYAFSATSNPALYADILEELIDSTEGRFPEGLE